MGFHQEFFDVNRPGASLVHRWFSSLLQWSEVDELMVPLLALVMALMLVSFFFLVLFDSSP